MDNPLAGLSNKASADPTSYKNSVRTPPELFARYNAIYDFQLDAAADHENHLAPYYATAPNPIGSSALYGPFGPSWSSAYLPFARDGVTAADVWVPSIGEAHGPVWINPPYGRGLILPFVRAWAINHLRHGTRVVMLLPARTSSEWFQQWIRPYVDLNRDVDWLDKRVRFLGPDGEPIRDRAGKPASAGFDCIVVHYR